MQNRRAPQISVYSIVHEYPFELVRRKVNPMTPRRTISIAALALSVLLMAACRGRSAEPPAQPTALPPTETAAQPTAIPPTAEPPTAAPAQPTAAPAQPTAAPPTAQPTEALFEAKGGTADSLKGAWSQAYALPPGVPFVVTTTEAEIQAMLDEKMAASSYGDSIKNLKVTLANGQIKVSFTLTISQQIGQKSVSVSADGSVVWAATIDSSGQLALAIVSADFGKLSIPPEMLAPLSEAITQAITGAQTGAQSKVTLTSLVIDNGLMTVKGYVTK